MTQTTPARDEAVLPITPERLAEVRERFDAIPHADPDSLTGHVKGMLALIDSLASAPAPASGVDAVAVKPLEWFEGLAVLPEQHASAQSVIGSYKAITFLTVGREPSLVSYWHGPEGRDIRVESFDEAKAAAQADYEQRIRSALSPAATPVSEAGPGLAKGCCSASSPCFHQKHDPTTICEACRNAGIRAEELTKPASSPAGGDVVHKAAETVRMSRRRHAGTYESSPFEFYPVKTVDALLNVLDLGGQRECEECSGTGHTGIDGDEVYDCPACAGTGRAALSPSTSAGA